jgi:hypothetical protein
MRNRIWRKQKMKKILPIVIIGVLIVSGIQAGASYKTTIERSATMRQTEYDMVIVAPEMFSDSLQPLITHKNSYGVDTFLKTTEEIYDANEGRDSAERVKYFIKDAIEQYNIRYVLLVGGMKLGSFDWLVPVRYSHLEDGFGYDTFLTDLYFADIYKNNGTEFDDWDSNGNGVFAEWSSESSSPEDVLDLQPDVAVGRLPCRSINEVKIVVKKIISYETTAYGQSWFNKMVVIGSDTWPDSEGAEGEATCDVAAGHMTDFSIQKLYASTGNLTGPSDIIDAVNQGCGFLMTRGKGGQDRVRMMSSEGAEFIAFQNKHISKLTNKDAYPICVLGECIHGRFDVGLLNIIKLLQKSPGYNIYDCIFECIAWRLIRENDAGAIAVLTNTNICFGSLGDKNHNGVLDDAESHGGFLAVELFRLYGQEGIQTLGLCHQQAISNYIDLFPVDTDFIHCKSIQEFILLGDPSLQIGGYY